MAARIAFFFIAGLFALLALLALAQAIFYGFAAIVPVGWAALLAALVYLLIAASMVGATRLRTHRAKPKGMSQYLPILADEVRRHPAKSLLIALAAGVIAEQMDRRRR